MNGDKPVGRTGRPGQSAGGWRADAGSHSLGRAGRLLRHLDECVEHHILLQKVGLPSRDIDKYFRIIFDSESANWTFVCPPGYKGIARKDKRITAFYSDGFGVISAFLAALGRLVDITIPKRYRRHMDALAE